MNLWATVAQATVGTTVSVIVTMFWRRTYKREQARIEQLITGVEAVFGIAPNTPAQKEPFMVTLAQYRKAVAAGLGVLLTGILTWLASDGVLATLLEPVVPDAFKPLIGVLAGGIATVVAVIRTTNQPAAAPTAAPAETAATPAVEVPTVTSPTSRIDLLPAPTIASYL